MQEISFTLPANEVATFEKMCKRASKNITDLNWTVGEECSRIYRHYVDGRIEKWSHRVCDVTLTIPEVNDWALLATIKDGAMFVTNTREKLELHNGHGTDYKICDVCKHPTWKLFYIIRNVKTNEELQVGGECAKKFGIGMMAAIHKLTAALYASYSMYASEYDGLEPIEWPSHYSDPYAVRSIETSVLVQAAKKYYDENNGVWKKGRYLSSGYYEPSESAAYIRASLDEFKPNEEFPYYVELKKWLNDNFTAGEYNDFEQSIEAVGKDFYMSAGDSAAAFFAIKKYEIWKKEKAARESGVYLPKRNDYIHIVGKVVNKRKMEGMFGDYTEYEIYNDIDKNLYKRAGVVKYDEDNNVDCYAYVESVWEGNYKLGRTTKNPKKGVTIANVF